MTLRLRLTLLYGACFIAAAAGLLAITYALFTGGSRATAVQISGSHFKVVTAGSAGTASAGGIGGTGGTGGSSGGGSAGLSNSGGGSAGASANGRFPWQRAPTPGTLSALAQRANSVLAAQRTGDRSLLLEESGIALGIVSLIAVALAWWVAGRALRPLRVMNVRARAITEDSLSDRLAVDARGDELGELAVTFDDLLARLERAFEAQRRFVANASHELRTPLTFERTLVEVALADPDVSVDSLRRVCERVVTSTEQQERLIDALLTLARSQSEIGERDPIDLAATVTELLSSRGARLVGVDVETALEPAAISGDAALIERMVANLLDNAIVHNAGEERWVRVHTATREGRAVLRIANGGAVIAAGQVDELFEPFRRLAGERGWTAGDDGLGLGLSIVRAIAIAHGAEVEARALEEGGLELELRFLARPVAVPA